MVVRLRLARHGTKNNPFYHIVAIRDKAARDARPIEKLGEYDPIPRVRTNQTKPPSSPADLNAGQVTTSGLENFQKQSKPEKRVEWNTQRIHYWLGVGAQPSKPVAKLLDRAGLIPEGKFYKGMFRPVTANIVSGGKAKDTASVILKAAGAKVTAPKDVQQAKTSTSLPQGHSLHGAQQTDPEVEAVKGKLGEATMDQAS